VRDNYAALLRLAQERQTRRQQKAHVAETVRVAMTWAGPLVALVLALLIGRSILLGVTRPLEDLTRATETLERGGGGSAGASASFLLLDGHGSAATGEAMPDDEIGDLQRAFVRMTRTIGQREAVLRAQNEALGALNRRIEAVLNATNDGILMLSREGGFSVVNQKAGELFGLDPDVLLDQTWEQGAPLLLGRCKNPADQRARFEALLEDATAVADETLELAEPRPAVLRVYSAPVRREAAMAEATPTNENSQANERLLLGRIFVLRDVTRETAVDRMKTEFISVVSHELRTPLTAIKGYVDLMAGGHTGPLNPIQTEFLTIVQNSTARLSALINDMLDISRIESGRIEVRHDALDYVRVARDVITTLRHEADAKQITLALEAPDDLPAVRGDADRITQVLMNLLSNAIKYTPKGGRVQVRIEPDKGFVTTCVADSGIGISLDDQKRLFQKFFRADNSLTREAGGTGLGLAITKAIVEKLNGGIWVESEVGRGSRFFFTLPVVEESANQGAGAPARQQPDPDGRAIARSGRGAAP
jgi:signal transduction histidine kinase